MNLSPSKTINIDTSKEYQALLRSLRRRKGFGLMFVETTPVGGRTFIEQVKIDLPQKRVGVLTLEDKIDNLIEKIKVFPEQGSLDVLFIVGLERSLVDYIRPGYGGKGEYYNLDTAPPILSHLNWQRENFRERFCHLCLVFILPRFAAKYLIKRAPNFFDWGNGKVYFATENNLLEQETNQIYQDVSWQEYQQLANQERQKKLIEIDAYLDKLVEPQAKLNLLFKKALLLQACNNHKEAIISYDKLIKIKSNNYGASYNRGIALFNLGRYKEAIASYDKALEIEPDDYN